MLTFYSTMDSGETDDELCSLGSTVQPVKKNGSETNIKCEFIGFAKQF